MQSETITTTLQHAERDGFGWLAHSLTTAVTATTASPGWGQSESKDAVWVLRQLLQYR